MANTGKGYPYPVGTDRLADGDNAIQALAAAVDAKLGTAAVGSNTQALNAAGSVSAVINFPAGRFTAAPAVMVQITSGFAASGTTNWVVAWPSGISAASFTLNVRGNFNAGNVNMTWMAIQPDP